MASEQDWILVALLEIGEGPYKIEDIQNKADELSYDKTPSKKLIKSTLLVLQNFDYCYHEDGSETYHIRL